MKNDSIVKIKITLIGLLFITQLSGQNVFILQNDTSKNKETRQHLNLLSDSIRQNPVIELYFKRGLLERDMGLWKEAESDLNVVIMHDSTDYRYYYERGVVRDRQKKLNEAFDDLIGL